MNNTEIAKWLDDAWSRVPQTGADESDEEVDRLINSKIQSIRYAVLTQILGKMADERRGILNLQLGNENSSDAWDARSFCTAVIVPWVGENQNVLGTSPDPYVNNPLRRPRLDEGAHQLRDKDEWDALVAFLSPLDSASRKDLETAFIRCLKSVARRLSSQSFTYPIPARVSMSQMHRALEIFLSDSSGGLRPLAVTAAMMTVLGRAFSIFAGVKSQGINESDSSTGALGDITCLDQNEKTIMVVEVKERALTLADIRASTRKARSSGDPLSDLLFAAPKMRKDQQDEIRGDFESAWASGLNINQVDILDLATSTFVLLPEEWRPKFMREIGSELDKRGSHGHRVAWHDILLNMGGKNA